MAEFNRKELRAIFAAAEIEVPKDVISQICDLHTDSSDGMGETIHDLKKQLATAEKERDEAVAKIPAEGEETVKKSAYDKLKGEYDTYKADVESKEATRAKKSAVRDMLKEIGVSDNRLDAVLRVYELDKVELDEDGKIKDADKRKEADKKEWADYIPTVTEKGASTANPPANNGGSVSKEEFDHMTYNQRVKLYEENQELYNKLTDKEN